VIGELLGVPAADSDNPDELRAALAALTGLLSALIVSKRETPADDLLTALLEVSDGDQLSQDELLVTAYLLILAGYEPR
jgi:cytochrome P450